MQNMLIDGLNKLRLVFVLLALSSAMTACSFPGVYKINVQQGNIVTQDMLDQLSRGMTRRQVHFVLGTPIVNNVFSDDYESYIYTYLPADGDEQRQVINIFYQNNQFTHYEGEVLEEHQAY